MSDSFMRQFDDCRAVVGRIKDAMEEPKVATETQLLHRIADIAHAGGLQGMSVESAQNEIRRLTIPYWQAALSAPAQPASGEAVIWSVRVDGKFHGHFCATSRAGAEGLRDSLKYQTAPKDLKPMEVVPPYTTPPASQEQAKWCEYVAGMVWCWIEMQESLPTDADEDRYTKAIAGIIECRLWALKREDKAGQEQAQPLPDGGEHF